MLKRKVAAILAIGALTVTLAACGSDSKDSKKNNKPEASPTATSAMPFGAGCAGVPKGDAKGSFSSMSSQPVATAASNNPLLTTLVKAVGVAGLGDTLNTTQNITVFAPADPAFAKIPADSLKALLADKAKLTKALQYHVVPGKLSPEQLAGTHKTLTGESLTVTGSGENFTVNGTAPILCGNVPTANATVYIIGTVLDPSTKVTAGETPEGPASKS
ncbi:MAG: fasciclin [Acidimicrobiales bacterium]|nr:MAG: fasciclin [Acidimicrobiales bacterium]